MLRGWQVWPLSGLRVSMGAECLDPQGGKEFSPDPQERDRVYSEGHLPLEGLRRRGWPGGRDSCQPGGAGTGHGPLPSLPGKALLSGPAPDGQASPLSTLLDPGTLKAGPELLLCSSPQGGALPASGEEKGQQGPLQC